MRKSANQGHKEAQYYLGAAYRYGQLGLARDDKQAIAWLRKSALQEHGDAEYALGLAYSEGWGVPKDPSEAFGWFRRAARHGNADAILVVRKIETRLKTPAGPAK